MTPFAHFLATHCGGQISLCARLLGLNRRSVYAYRDGQPPPEYVLLACAAVVAGLPPYRSNDVKEPAPE